MKRIGFLSVMLFFITTIEATNYLFIEQNKLENTEIFSPPSEPDTPKDDPCFVIGNIIFDTMGENEQTVEAVNKICDELKKHKENTQKK